LLATVFDAPNAAAKKLKFPFGEFQTEKTRKEAQPGTRLEGSQDLFPPH